VLLENAEWQTTCHSRHTVAKSNPPGYYPEPMGDANLYLDKVDFTRYLSGSECKKCGSQSCKELVDKLRKRDCLPADLDLARDRIRGIEMALDVDGLLPRIPMLQMPQPGTIGMMELNGPASEDPVLITGNSALTQEVLLAVLSTTMSSFTLLFVDTHGDTLDMAIILDSFTPERVASAVEKEKPGGSRLVLPGLAGGMAAAIASATGFRVEVGPVCAAELPLFFGDRWKPSQG
jgi:CO dehydrogenase/acetyl-CoA synthase gamma subunit (corrinoid Fe-S protein)